MTSVAVARLVATGTDARCFCFGGAGARLGRRHVARNGILTTVALAAVAVTAVDDRTVAALALAPLALISAAPAAVFIFWDDLAALLRAARSEG